MIDLDQIKRLAEGDGTDKVLVTKRWLRAIAVELEKRPAAHPTDDTFQSVFDSVFRTGRR
ncbi:hypothetical protein M527_07100 [Sphingobium indicum IP26]|uniref:Uncharacterized protein n=1 Tax=Sphingobium indicum F2 TaxID=1450518 RepID=A0A8E1C338_9SPHN|nr:MULTISPECIES: hypothetical protein [Sphingobium]EPR09884.1 hypothetical protein M527_07100 [Sphingobium indicum IP26]EQB05012.1 hypothetical protein L286_09615 [Sphingobium sp. HDIP04]KER36681.1 hypothetical protein AL00_09405 [Sphingobium indicum F2]